MKKLSKKDIVLKILKEKGEIDNFYCIDNRITTRLGSIINLLKKEGYKFDDERSGYMPGTKNWRYIFTSKQKVEYRVPGTDIKWKQF